MGLQDFWFVALAALFVGFLLLEGFDFGVGMLMEFFARNAPAGNGELHKRTVLNTIGPVWDGNEVWLITAGGAMFAAFPEMYATVFSGLYLPLLAILVSMIVRICAIEWRGKVDDPKWRTWADVAIAVGSWVPAVLWGCHVRRAGARTSGQRRQANRALHRRSAQPVRVAWRARHGWVVRVSRCRLRLAEDVGCGPRRRGAVRGPAGGARHPRRRGGVRNVDSAGPRQGLDVLVLGVAVVAQITAVMLVWSRGGDGWAFACTATVVVAVVALLFGSLYPNLVPSTLNPAWSLDVHNASSSPPYTLTVMSWAALIFAPLVIGYQAWTYWVFRQRISADRIPAPIGLSPK